MLRPEPTTPAVRTHRDSIIENHPVISRAIGAPIYVGLHMLAFGMSPRNFVRHVMYRNV